MKAVELTLRIYNSESQENVPCRNHLSLEACLCEGREEARPRPRELRAFFSCMAWRAIPGPLSKRKRRLDWVQAVKGGSGAGWDNGPSWKVKPLGGTNRSGPMQET